MRIVIDYGHGSDTFPPSKGINLPGGGSFEEHTYNAKVGKKLKAIMEDNGVEVYEPQPPNRSEVPLSTRITNINNEHSRKPFDLLVSIHANASSSSNASGFGVFHWHTSTGGKRAAELLVDEMRKTYPIGAWGSGVWQSQRGSWTNFGILRATRPVAILSENFFFTNHSERELMLKDENIDKAVIAHANAIAKFLGIELKQPTTDSLYRVQTGAFENKANAERLEAKLKDEGFDTYLVKADGLYKVQVGAYANKSNADRMEERLKDAGYDTYITTQSGEAANTAPAPEPFKVGDKVKVDPARRGFASFVYDRVHEIRQLRDDEALLTFRGEIMSWVELEYLIKQ